MKIAQASCLVLDYHFWHRHFRQNGEARTAFGTEHWQRYE